MDSNRRKFLPKAFLFTTAAATGLVNASCPGHAFIPSPAQHARVQAPVVPRVSPAPRHVALSLSSDAKDDEAQALLDKVSQIRAEIAALEGKTVAEVEAEAKAKIDAEESRKAEAEAARAARDAERKNSSAANKRRLDRGTYMDLPVDQAGQVQQAAGAVERAFKDGLTRQTVRFALVPEGENMYDLQEWPGGAQQMSREAAVPLTEALLREIRAETDVEDQTKRMGGLPPKVGTQTIWDFDGSSLVTAEASTGPTGDAQALVLPNTDGKYTTDIDTIDGAMGDRLFLLVNPFWRDLDSWGYNIMAPNAKKRAQKIIFDRGYNETYAFNRMSVRGETCVALKAYPYEWQMYAYVEDEYFPNQEVPVRLGSSKEEPTSKQFTELLNAREEFKLSKNMRQMQRMMKK